MTPPLRRLGTSDIHVTSLALGCWPIAGMTTLHTTERDSLATIEAAYRIGINFFDTAYCYGADGESERMIGRVLGKHRADVVIATKGGIAWDENRKQVKDAQPTTLRRHCEASLERLGMDHVDLLYLHAPDPATPIRESAGELRRLMEEGKTRAVGASNVTVAQLDEFRAECPVVAVQPHYNMLQREIEADLLPYCREHQIAVCSYWPLLKGFLAGKLPRDHVFEPGDGRAKYPMYQGEEWSRNHDFLDALRPIAAAAGCTLAELVLAWTTAQPGITCALVGAKRPDQIEENAGALRVELSELQMSAIDRALAARGKAASRGAV
ncbi:MAG: aldo/keto reductase [Planctomycetales bacterium]|nr:aldo/keto reductase [Planctomycetales bacterium]